MNVLIVDDEPLARDILQAYVDVYDEFIGVYTSSNAIEAREVLQSKHIDLMLLDIHMPGLTGLDFLKMLDHPPVTILTTAHPDHAIEGYQYDILDYLLKPISKERFDKTIQRFLQQKNVTSTKEQDDYIFVKSDKKLIKVLFDDLLYIEGLKDYVIIHTPHKRIVTLQTMKNLETKLSKQSFVRIHRSFIINISKIEMLEGNTLFINSKRLPIGKIYKEEINKLIDDKRL